MDHARAFVRRHAPLALLAVLLGSAAHAQAPAPGQFAAPKPGPAPLPTLAALPRIDDASFYAQANVPHGTVVQATYRNQVGQDKRMHIYLPPGYDKDTGAKYPVLYLNHGGGDDDSRWTSTNPQGGSAQFILDNLIAAGKARPMIVVMPNTQGLAAATPSTPGKDDACTTEYLKDIIPYVESHYRAKAGRENRALAGLSMGGFVVMNTGLTHLDTFGELYVYSSGYFPQNLQAFEDNLKPVLADPRTNEALLRVPLYMAAGETDIALPNAQKTLSVLNRYAVRNFWVLSTGGHEWANWRRYLWQTAQVMFAEDPKAGSIALAHAPAGYEVAREGIARGKTEMLEYDSKSVGIQRKARVYLPPGYSTAAKYPVLYLLHGIGGGDGDWIGAGKADAILDNLFADKKAAPMIVVMPNGRASKTPAPQNPFSEDAMAVYAAFEDDLLKDLAPAVEAKYSARTDADGRAIAGLSMGGGQALNFGLKHLDTFAWVGGFSSAPNTLPIAELVPDPAATTKKLRLLWVSVGDKDFIIQISLGVHAGLTERKVPHVWYLESGAHEWPVWKNDLYQFAQMVFRPAKP